MNQQKFAAAQRLNELENSRNILNEQIAQAQATLDHAKAVQRRTTETIADLRQAVAAMPD